MLSHGYIYISAKYLLRHISRKTEMANASRTLRLKLSQHGHRYWKMLVWFIAVLHRLSRPRCSYVFQLYTKTSLEILFS